MKDLLANRYPEFFRANGRFASGLALELLVKRPEFVEHLAELARRDKPDAVGEPPIAMKIDPVYSAAQAGAILERDSNTYLSRAVRQGRLPASPKGQRKTYRTQDLAAEWYRIRGSGDDRMRAPRAVPVTAANRAVEAVARGLISRNEAMRRLGMEEEGFAARVGRGLIHEIADFPGFFQPSEVAGFIASSRSTVVEPFFRQDDSEYPPSPPRDEDVCAIRYSSGAVLDLGGESLYDPGDKAAGDVLGRLTAMASRRIYPGDPWYPHESFWLGLEL